MKRLDALTSDELMQTALALVQESGHTESWRIPRDVAEQLGASTHDEASVGVPENRFREYSAAVARFSGRVSRALGKLADQGLIVKVGARETLPSGGMGGQFAHYYTPKAYQAALAERDAARATAEVLAGRWKAINQRLLTQIDCTLNRQHQLSVDEWERLLDRAGWW